jgi:Reverse transcriptase (RNA-dependent DNA polymerase)
MKQPEGFVEPGLEDLVAKLLRSIYGTMQGGHDWFETLSAGLKKLLYITSRADPCVRIKKENGNYTITKTYTDDTFGASNSKEEEEKRKKK